MRNFVNRETFAREYVNFNSSVSRKMFWYWSKSAVYTVNEITHEILGKKRNKGIWNQDHCLKHTAAFPMCSHVYPIWTAYPSSLHITKFSWACKELSLLRHSYLTEETWPGVVKWWRALARKRNQERNSYCRWFHIHPSRYKILTF